MYGFFNLFKENLANFSIKGILRLGIFDVYDNLGSEVAWRCWGLNP